MGVKRFPAEESWAGAAKSRLLAWEMGLPTAADWRHFSTWTLGAWPERLG